MGTWDLCYFLHLHVSLPYLKLKSLIKKYKHRIYTYCMCLLLLHNTQSADNARKREQKEGK